MVERVIGGKGYVFKKQLSTLVEEGDYNTGDGNDSYKSYTGYQNCTTDFMPCFYKPKIVVDRRLDHLDGLTFPVFCSSQWCQWVVG